MKKVIVFILAIFALTFGALADEFNPVVPSGEVTLGTTVITPLSHQSTNVGIAAGIVVIKGQLLDFAAAGKDKPRVEIEISGEAGKDVLVTFYQPAPVGSTVLIGEWLDEDDNSYGSQGNAIFTMPPDSFFDVFFEVGQIDAQSETVKGVKTFELKCDMQYVNL